MAAHQIRVFVQHLPELRLVWLETARVLSIDGNLVMNVPFLYWIHEHPHDYYRYTNFALARIAARSGFSIMMREPVGRAAEVLAHLVSKMCSKLSFVGHAITYRTHTFRRLAEKTVRHLPAGYFIVAQRVV